VVRQGWLSQQLKSVLGAFSKSAGFDRGLTQDELTSIDPFACTSTPTADEVNSNLAQGDRWAFVQDLFDGSFEEILRLPADQIRFDALYESVLVDPKSIHVIGSQNNSSGVAAFLKQAISDGGLAVPVGFLRLLVTGSDPRLIMKRLVWWPRSLVELPQELASDDELVESELRESDLMKPWEEYDTRFAMSVQVSWSEPFSYDDFLLTKPSALSTSSGEKQLQSES
jgi:hypothetical protein